MLRKLLILTLITSVVLIVVLEKEETTINFTSDNIKLEPCIIEPCNYYDLYVVVETSPTMNVSSWENPYLQENPVKLRINGRGFDRIEIRKSLTTQFPKHIIEMLEKRIPGEFTYEEILECGQYQTEDFCAEKRYNLTSITMEGVATLNESYEEIWNEIKYKNTKYWTPYHDNQMMPYFSLSSGLGTTIINIPYHIMEHSEVVFEYEVTATDVKLKKVLDTKKVFIVCEGSYNEPVCRVDRVEEVPE